MWSYLRQFVIGPEAVITKEEAVRIAVAECERRGFATNDPEAKSGKGVWIVLARPYMRGAPIITIDSQTGAVISFASLPR